AAGNRLYFPPNGQPFGTELWVSDGRPGGTHLIRDVDPSTADSDPQLFTAGVGGTYFGTNLGIYLYTESTRKVTLLASISGDPVQFIGRVGAVEVIAVGYSLWRSDGTKAGTKKIYAASNRLNNLAIAGGTL